MMTDSVTTTPLNLVLVGTVYGDAVYVERTKLAAGNRFLKEYRRDGTPIKQRKFKGSAADWEPVYLHPGNVFIVGLPGLPDGWQQAAEEHHESLIAEVCN